MLADIKLFFRDYELGLKCADECVLDMIECYEECDADDFNCRQVCGRDQVNCSNGKILFLLFPVQNFEIKNFQIAHVMLTALMGVMDATIESVLAMNRF